jgi:hypothetical protein
MSTFRCSIGLWLTGVAFVSLSGCAGQMPSVAGFMQSPGITATLAGFDPKKISQAEHSFRGPYNAEDYGFGESIGATFGDRWRIGGQVALPVSAALTGGYLGDHFGSMNWLGTSLSGVSGGTALIEHATAWNWLRIGSFQYLARNEMIGDYSSMPFDFVPDPITEGSVGYLEVGAGAVLAMRKEFWGISPIAFEAKMGRDLTFGFTRYYALVSISMI